MSWDRVNEVFHLVLEAPADRRGAVLADACGSDAALRAEIESLLAAHAADPSFLESPAITTTTPAVDRSPSALPDVIGPYRILKILGEGGMGVVYLAEDTRLGRLVALKAVAHGFSGGAARRERLRREARAAASLAHPGIATVYALEDIDSELYLASEYVAGRTLRDELALGALPARAVTDTAVAIADAVGAAHDRGLVHRDLKPENVMRTATGSIKILDFGLARLPEPRAGEPRLTAEGAMLGTPGYMSPEQIRGLTVDPRSDVFSLGLLIYELAAGESPFNADAPASTVARILKSDAVPLAGRPDVDPNVARALDKILQTCLAKSPADRYPSARELAVALDRARSALVDGRDAARSDAVRTSAARTSDASTSAFWWWQFHQAAASAGYLAVLIPLWYVRAWIGGVPGSALFLGALIAALVASALRLHLWFTARAYPAESDTQRVSTARWIRAGDAALVLLLLVDVGLTLAEHNRMAVLLVAAAVVVALSAAVIEPATTRAAFDAPIRSRPDQPPSA